MEVIAIGVFAALLAVSYMVRQYRMTNAARKIQRTWRCYRHNKLLLEMRRTVAKAVFDDRKKKRKISILNRERIGVADELNFRKLKSENRKSR